MSNATEARLGWWQEARFGMFIHWGLYAAPAGEWKGKKIPGIGEWIMRGAKIPIEEYEQIAKTFNPVDFDADAWAEVARQAGMRYLVITAKHHDGFCMFDSPSNPYNIVAQTPFKKDPMKALAASCHKRGIRMCFYYSQAQDWHAPGGAGHWEDETPDKDWLSYNRPAEEFQQYLDDVVKPNLRELLTQYGPVGLIWFDTPVAITQEQSESLRDLVHELQPACLVSGRVGHGVGDYSSLGDNQHPSGPLNAAWETPATLNDTWGYKHDDHNWKTFEDLLDLLVNCAAKGVNYLLNVGPTAAGVIPQPSVERLQQLGDWLERNGEAIYGTSISPFAIDPSWGRVTARGRTLYLLVRDWPEDALQLYGLRNNVCSARVLGCKDAPVKVEQDGDTLTVFLSGDAPEATVSVIALELDGLPQVEDIVIQQGDTGIELPAHVAELEGDITLKPEGVIDGWTTPANRATWTFRVKRPGRYTVTAVRKVNRNCLKQYGMPSLSVDVAGTQLTGQCDETGIDKTEGARVMQQPSNKLGTCEIKEAGDYKLVLTADKLDPDADRGLYLTRMVLAKMES